MLPSRIGNKGGRKAGLVSLFIFASSPAWSQAADASSDTLRVGFASQLFSEVNENDAKAAIKVWGQTVAKERGILANPETSVFKDDAAILDALLNKLVDIVAVTTVQMGALSREVKFAPVFVTYNCGRPTEQYVLLAHQDNHIGSVVDLRHRSLAFQANARNCLASRWLDVLLIQNSLPPAANYATKITHQGKLAKVILPVFFRQTDACVVTRSGFEMMQELNPQVGKQLKIIASSAEFVPVVFAFRADYNPVFRERLLAGMRELHKTPTGQQVLTIFQSEKIEEQPASCLDSAFELLATHQALCRPVSDAPGTPSPPVASVKEVLAR